MARSRVTVTVTGEKQVLGRLEQELEEAEDKVKALIAKYALKIEATVKKKLSGPGSGRVYYRGEGIVHQASAPGEPPATDTGRLRASVHHVLEGVAAQVIADTEYAAALEFGTDKIEPRPYMKPALEEHKDDFIRDLRVALRL